MEKKESDKIKEDMQKAAVSLIKKTKEKILEVYYTFS